MKFQFLEKYSYYLQLAAGLGELLRNPVEPDPAGFIQENVRRRESAFLDTVRRGIFERPGCAYHRMFELAGCGYQDLADEVRKHGLESALATIHREGIYLTHDEFKCKAPIVRAGRHIPSDETSFTNPLVTGGVQTSSGGSRSKGTATRTGRARWIHNEAYTALTISEFGLADRDQIHVRPILPAGDGVFNCLMYTRLGCRVDRWYSPVGQTADSAHYRAATNCMVAVSRLRGHKFPFPTYLPPNDFSTVARRIAERKRQGVACMVGSYVSPAARVAAAANELGLDISGTLFFVSGEPLSDPKRRVIESAGGRVFSRYWIAEVGPIGFGCSRMTSGNCVHLFLDSIAAITYRRRAPITDVEVDSLLFTNLLPSAAYLFINAEMDDSGVVEPARCDCEFSRAGLTLEVRDIYSYGKLTGQGMTLLGTDIVRILEEALPSRFGGQAGDYQLVEAEGALQTQLTLRVSKGVALGSREDVRNFFLGELRKYQGGATASRIWGSSAALDVVHEEPLPTATGKVLSLHLLAGGSEARHGS